MSSTVETAVEIRPFHVEVPEEDLVDLRRRIAAAWQEPELFTAEIRAAFRPLRGME